MAKTVGFAPEPDLCVDPAVINKSPQADLLSIPREASTPANALVARNLILSNVSLLAAKTYWCFFLVMNSVKNRYGTRPTPLEDGGEWRSQPLAHLGRE
jgi:hypothetical protein